MCDEMLTASLRAWQSGSLDRQGQEALACAVYAELKRLARQRLSREPARPFTPTELVHETWLKLKPPTASFGERQEFFRLASTIMRNLLVDQARERLSARRGGGVQNVTLNTCDISRDDFDDVQLLDFERALRGLAVDHPRAADVAVMRSFAGLELEEMAVMLDVSLTTVKRDWTFARAWLSQAMNDTEPGNGN